MKQNLPYQTEKALLPSDDIFCMNNTGHVPVTKTQGPGARKAFCNCKVLTKSVLVMDDDPVLRDVFRLMVEACGYKAQVAEDGDEAVESYSKARECGFPFDAVILDLNNVNGKGGRETIRKLCEIDPDVRAIVMSGSVDDPELTNFWEYGFRCALRKPFTLDELKLALQRVTDGAAVGVEATSFAQGRMQ